jgi:SAM-dependent methyltransferase
MTLRRRDPVKLTIRTYDKIAPDYCSHTMIEEIRVIERQFLDRFLDLIEVRNPMICDLGCGDARDSTYLAMRGARVVSVDLSKGMLGEARKLFSHGCYVLMDFRSPGFLGASFNGVWCSGSVYHIPKKQMSTTIEAVRDTIKPGGVFCFNFKVGSGEGMEKEPRSFGSGPRYFAYYSVEEITEYLAGFSIVHEDEYPQEIFGDRIVQLWARKS